mgnify:CR=1 FL=1
MKKISKIYFIIFIFLFKISLCKSQVNSKIDTTEITQIGGIKQLISIKGNDKEKPILLFLHGGPGSSLIEVSENYTDQLKNEFVIINWDQRETGETLKLNPTNVALTQELFKNDTYEIITFILKRFSRDKLYLVSHSWGSVLGFDIVEKHPELLYAYIAISPIINQTKSSELTMETLKNWAIKSNWNSFLLQWTEACRNVGSQQSAQRPLEN